MKGAIDPIERCCVLEAENTSLRAENEHLQARCAELMNAIDNYIDARDKAMTENEHLRMKVAQQDRRLSYLLGVKDTVTVIFGRRFGAQGKAEQEDARGM